MPTYLTRIFRATEAANYRALLELAPGLPGAVVLDCGCGDGEFSARLAKAIGAREIWGVESVEHRVRAATERGLRVVSHDLNLPLPFDDGQFDVVCANQLLEHLHSTDEFLRQLHRVLRPGGRLLLSTNNLASWHNVVSLVLGQQPPPMHVSGEVILGNRFDPFRGTRFGSKEDSHLRIFAWRGLTDLVRHHGFEVESLLTVGRYPFPPVIARAMNFVDPRHGVFLTGRFRRPS